jgi:hypothetical protein
MIFNEIYSAYYNTVAKIIGEVIDGNTDERKLNDIVLKNAFSESITTILPSLKSGKWQLITPDFTTPINNKPSMPLSNVQKQWLKAISLDERIRLFGINFDFLDDVEPLFTSEDYFIYDKYSDGDDYGDEGYISRFQTILSAIREGCPLRIKHVNRKGYTVGASVLPLRLEYSEKDDKFRLINAGNRYSRVLNLSRIVSCEKFHSEFTPAIPREPKKETLVLKIYNKRNTLERCMLHFAHFEKWAEKIDNEHYIAHIKYDKSDETELVIRVLSFGPTIEALEPQCFRDLIINRLKRQKSCEL